MQKRKKSTTEDRAVYFSYFFPHFALLYPACAEYLPGFSTQNYCFQFYHTFQQSSWDSHPIVSFKFHFSLLLFSFLYFSPCFLQSLSHPCRKENEKKKNGLHFNNQNNSETMLLRSHLLPTHLPRQQMMGIPG